MSGTAAPDLLETIVGAARRIIEVRQRQRPEAALAAAQVREPQGDAFRDALAAGDGFRIIAECKRRSPSRGILREDYRPDAHAAAYERAGAAAISVLTEPTFFDGAPAHLAAVRRAVGIPLLRKDFIVTRYQLVEAAVLGADAVLLIAGALPDVELRALLDAARGMRLEALVEVHDEHELQRAVDAGSRVIGVNSRNLRTLAVDTGVLDRLAPLLPRGVVAVAESGIRTTADLRRLRAAGYSAFLVGERLIADPDPGRALAELMAS